MVSIIKLDYSSLKLGLKAQAVFSLVFTYIKTQKCSFIPFQDNRPL